MTDKLMTDDPLKFLLDCSGYTVIKNKRKHQLASFALLSVGIFMIIAGIRDGFLSREKLKPFILGIIFHLTSELAFLTSCIYGHDVNLYKDMVFQNCYSLDAGGPTIKKRIMDEIKMIKRYCFIPVILTSITALSFLPFVGDEDKFLFQVTLLDEWFGKRGVVRFFVNILFAFHLGICGWIVGNTIPITAYIIFHLKFQFMLLDRHLEKLKNLLGEENKMERQSMVQEVLKDLVKNHIRIKKLQKDLLRRQDFYMILLTPPMIITFVALLYFIKTEVSPPSNFRIVLCLTTAVVTFWFHCIHGQLLNDQSAKLHDKLYACNWTHWNKSNRKSLLIILPEIEKPMKVTCLGLVDLDYPYILFVGRAIYSLLAVAMSFI